MPTPPTDPTATGPAPQDPHDPQDRHDPSAARPWYQRPVLVALSTAALTLTCVLGVGVPVVVHAQQQTAASSTTGTMTQTAVGNGAAQDGSGSQGQQAAPGIWDQGSDGRGTGENDTGSDGVDGPTGGQAGPGGQGSQTGPGGAPGADGQTGGSSDADASTTADTDESTGVVLIDTDLAYQSAEAAGTGMVLTSDGQVLTNNHVLDGATEIEVTVPSTDKTYDAKVVGTDEDSDVALLQLTDASGLDTVTVDEDDDTAAADGVTAVGNSEGEGTLMAADGDVTDLDGTVTTSAEAGSASETLDGMIVFSADVVSGDSGGALLDEDGEVIGMTTAASTGSGEITGFAIPIDSAMDVVDQIRSGDETDGITIGYSAFLGIAAGDGRTSGPSAGQTGEDSGALVMGVYDDAPAADVGLAQGDVITAVDGDAISSSDDLTDVLSDHDPGDSISLTWIDTDGDEHTASTTLTEGPA
jgi:S1-C subfamily serine protease